MIELTPQAVDRIIVDLLSDIAHQRRNSVKLRKQESAFVQAKEDAEERLAKARSLFCG